MDLIQKAQKPIFALVISHSGCENKLMFIYVILKSLISRAQLVKLGVKSQFLNYNSKVHSGGSLLMHVSIAKKAINITKRLAIVLLKWSESGLGRKFRL